MPGAYSGGMATTLLTHPPAARLLVLVPDGELPIVDLAQHIWALAAAAGSAVLLVGLADGPEREAHTRRTLAELQSHTQFDPVPVSIRVACVPDWVTAVKHLRRPGDQVVVFAEQEAPAGVWGWRRQPLAQALETQLRVPAYVVTDVALPAAPRPSRWVAAARWALSLVVIAVFFGVQAAVQSAMPGGTGSLVLVLLVIIEFGLLSRLQHGRM